MIFFEVSIIMDNMQMKLTFVAMKASSAVHSILLVGLLCMQEISEVIVIRKTAVSLQILSAIYQVTCCHVTSAGLLEAKNIWKRRSSMTLPRFGGTDTVRVVLGKQKALTMGMIIGRS